MNHLNYVTQWSRKCPKCGGVIYHQSKKDRDRRERENRTCGGKANLNCKLISKDQRKKLHDALIGVSWPKSGRVDKSTKPKWTRKCPRCGKTIGYHGKSEHFRRAEKNNSMCFSCVAIVNDFQKNRVNPKKIKKMRATKAGFSSWSEYVRKFPKWKRYKAEVWRLTYANLRKNPPLPNYEKRGLCGVKGAYQIDHVTSVRLGFDKKIKPEVIAEYKNLRMLPWKDNLLKH